MFDRIDLHVEVGAVNPMDLTLPPPAENSAAIAARVAAARDVQKARYAARGLARAERTTPDNDPPVRTNAKADGTLLEKIAAPDDAGRKLLADAAERLKLSACGYHRMLRVARTLADLDGADSVRRLHIAEALSFRRVAPNRAAV